MNRKEKLYINVAQTFASITSLKFHTQVKTLTCLNGCSNDFSLLRVVQMTFHCTQLTVFVINAQIINFKH